MGMAKITPNIPIKIEDSTWTEEQEDNFKRTHMSNSLWSDYSDRETGLTGNLKTQGQALGLVQLEAHLYLQIYLG